MILNARKNLYLLATLSFICGLTISQNSFALQTFTATLTAPLNNSVVSGTAVLASASIQSSTTISKVVFFRDNRIEVGRSTLFPFKISIDSTKLTNGNHTFFAIATDQTGIAAATGIFNVNVQNSIISSIRLSSPANAATLSGSAALFSASIQSSLPISKVVYFRDNWVEIGTSATLPFNLSLDTKTLSNGAHTFFAVATNSIGATVASGIISAQVQNLQIFSVNMSSPAFAAELSGSAAMISASVQSPNAISKVVFFRDNWIEIGTTTLFPYQISLDTNLLNNGGHTFFAVATDSLGQAAASGMITAQVQNFAPVVVAPAPVVVAPAPVVTNVCQAGAVVGWDPLPTFKKSYIVGGKYAGAYTVGPVGYLNWYFSSLGLLGFIDRLPASEIKQYLDTYMANLERPSAAGKGYNIQDINFTDPYQTSTSAATKKPQDSDDSYAATILSVASRYIACSQDVAWLNAQSKFASGETNLQVLKKIADYNLVQTTNDSSTGLVHTFQDLNKYAMYYTEDNAEAYKGLVDFSRLLSSIGDVQASEYARIASGIANALENLLFINQLVPNLATGANTNVSGYALGYSGIIEPITSNFYPGAVTHLFPTALGVPISSAHAASAVVALNKMAPNWCNQIYDTAGRDPFMILGYASAVLGDRASAQCQLDFYAQQAQLGAATITVSGLGFYQRTVSVLQGQAPY